MGEPETTKAASRGGVLSIRVNQEEMDALAKSAERAGKSVSEYARDTLRRSTRSVWKLNVWSGGTAIGPATPMKTGGEYGRQIGRTDPSLRG